MKGLFTVFLFSSLFGLSGCELTEEEKEKLNAAANNLEQLADQIIITYPAKGSMIDQSIVTVRADIPASAEAQEVALYVDGIEIAKDADGAPWEIQWPAYYSADGGEHTLLLKTITGSGNEVRNNEQFKVTVSQAANQALAFSAGTDGTQIQDQSTLDVSFDSFPTASRYEVSSGSQVIGTSTTSTTLTDLSVGMYTLRYRAVFDYSDSTILEGPWSDPVQVEVLAPELPIIHAPIVTKNGSTYDLTFSWDVVNEDDTYSIMLKKNSDNAITTHQASSVDSLDVLDIEMGIYSWSLIRTTVNDQSSTSSLNEIGVGVFKRQFGGSADDYADHVIASQDGGFIILGDTKSKGDAQGDDWIIKLDAHGNTEWEYVLNKTGTSRLDDLREFSDGSIYAFGSNRDYQDLKGYIVKLSGEINPVERLVWELEYRNEETEQENFRSLTEKDSSLYVLSEERVRVDLGNGGYKNELSKVKLIHFGTDTGSFISAVELPALADGSIIEGARYLSVTSDNEFLLSCSAVPLNAGEYYIGGGLV